MKNRMGSEHRVADREVLERARTGDRDALADLFRVYHPQILRLLRAKRAVAAEDIAAQVWVDVGRSLAQFDGDGRSFQRWIFTIASRRAIDEVRRSGRRRETSLENHDVADPDADPAASSDPVESSVEFVASLPTQMAEAVMLRIVYDVSVEETAEIMNTTPGNVRVLTHRGLTKLRRRMAGSTAEVSPSADQVIDVDLSPAEISPRTV